VEAYSSAKGEATPPTLGIIKEGRSVLMKSCFILNAREINIKKGIKTHNEVCSFVIF
jgi:hypothetical protein